MMKIIIISNKYHHFRSATNLTIVLFPATQWDRKKQTEINQFIATEKKIAENIGCNLQ